jgi:carbon storage regulator
LAEFLSTLKFQSKETDMLILTRRPNEAVLIGNHVRIQVLGFKGGQVRLGIDAPLTVEVDREEVRLRKQEAAERLASTESQPSAATVEEFVAHPRDARLQSVEVSPIPHRAVG